MSAKLISIRELPKLEAVPADAPRDKYPALWWSCPSLLVAHGVRYREVVENRQEDTLIDSTCLKVLANYISYVRI